MLVVGLTAMLLSVAAARQIEWRSTLYNPKPLDDDVIVPMPCGGAMVFRPITTEVGGVLDDNRIEIGNDAESVGYVEHTRFAYVAGAFPAAETGRRQLLIGKYEVSELQYDAVETDTDGASCPQPTGKGRLAKTRVSWHDAVSFCHRYSLWLRGQAPMLPDCDGGGGSCLPRVDGIPAFVRLPSEAEWEFAARGGNKVTPADFREPHFPMPDGVQRYVWFNETADGKVKPTGVLDPNPVGLHDMLGNVEEIALEPFRLRRLDRPHGQSGGYVVRGGSIHSSRAELRASLRREVPFYDDRGAVNTADTGFRLVLSVPVLTSSARLADVRTAWTELGSDESRPRPASSARAGLDEDSFDDPILELTALARAAQDPAMRRRLERLRADVANNAEKLYQQRNRNARETLRFGGLLCSKLHDEGHNVRVKQALYDKCVEGNGADYPRCKKYSRALNRDRSTLDWNIRTYADAVVRTAQTYPDDLGVLRGQLRTLKTEIADRGYPDYVVYPDAFYRQVVVYVEHGRVQRDVWYQTCVDLG